MTLIETRKKKFLHAFLFAARNKKILHAFHTQYHHAKTYPQGSGNMFQKWRFIVRAASFFWMAQDASSQCSFGEHATYISDFQSQQRICTRAQSLCGMLVRVDSKNTDSNVLVHSRARRQHFNAHSVLRFGDKSTRSCSTGVQFVVQFNASMKSENAKRVAQSGGPSIMDRAVIKS